MYEKVFVNPPKANVCMSRRYFAHDFAPFRSNRAQRHAITPIILACFCFLTWFYGSLIKRHDPIALTQYRVFLPTSKYRVKYRGSVSNSVCRAILPRDFCRSLIAARDRDRFRRVRKSTNVHLRLAGQVCRVR